MFQSWYQQLWPALARAFSVELAQQPQQAALGSLYRLEVTQGELTPSPYVSSYNAVPLTVLTYEELNPQNGRSPRSTRCIEVELPTEVSFKAGDHLGVLAYNPTEYITPLPSRSASHTHTLLP